MKPLALGLVAGGTVVVALALGAVLLLAGLGVSAKAPNAACPACLTPYHISGTEHMSVPQQLAVDTRCPFCGRRSSVFDAHAQFTLAQVEKRQRHEQELRNQGLQMQEATRQQRQREAAQP